MLPWPEYSHFAASLFALLIPFAAVPAYLSLTQGFTACDGRAPRSWPRYRGRSAPHHGLVGPGHPDGARSIAGIAAGRRRSGASADGTVDAEATISVGRARGEWTSRPE
jgi:hypothetical protein